MCSVSVSLSRSTVVSRKKRARYKTNAAKLASEHGIRLDLNDWDQIWSVLDLYEEPCYLYAIGDRNVGLVKFGKSKTPGQRLKMLNTGNGSALVLWAYCRHESPFTEKEVHKALAKHRVHGEWFSLCEEVQSMVNAIKNKALYA